VSVLIRFDMGTRELGEGPAKTRMQDMTVEKSVRNRSDVAETMEYDIISSGDIR
jgi:hypothetical protein